MTRLLPCVLAGLLLLGGCYTTTASGPSADLSRPEPVLRPTPAMPDQVAAGLAQALIEGDLAKARSYYLSAEEFDALFAWPGPTDPRADWAPRVEMALQAAAAELKGGQFVRAEETRAVLPLAKGTSLAGVTLETDTEAIDRVVAVVNIGGREQRLRIDGLLRVGPYWRVYSPTIAVLK